MKVKIKDLISQIHYRRIQFLPDNHHKDKGKVNEIVLLLNIIKMVRIIRSKLLKVKKVLI